MQKGSDYYRPSDDTFFLADFIQKEKGRAALDIGTGSGFLASLLAENFELVVASDISLEALQEAKKKVGNCICCQSADALHCFFDLVVCNLPYLPSDKIEDAAVDGLGEGLGVPGDIIRSASRVVGKNGRLVYLTSSLANYAELVKMTESLGFAVKIGARKKLFFEELIIVDCTKV